MKMTSFQIVLIAIFSSCAVAGVLVFAFLLSNSNTGSVGALTIWGTLDQQQFSTLLRQFSDKDQNFLQVSYVQKDPATFDDDLTRAIAAGTPPDLFLLRQDYAIKDENEALVIPYSGVSYAVSRSQFASTFADVAQPFLVPSGVLAVPYLADPLVLYWNKDILSTYGFAQPPQYWDQLPAMVAAITKKGDAGQITLSTIPLGEYTNVDNAKSILSLMILQIGGSITEYQNDKLIPTLTSVQGSAAGSAEKSLQFYTSFADPSNHDMYTWNRSLPRSRAAFAGGGSALYIGFASEESLIKKMNPNLNFAVAKVPQIRAASTTIDFARVYGLAIPRNAKNPTGSLTLAYFLASSANATNAASMFALSPVRRDALSQSFDGDLKTFTAETIMSRSWVDPDPVATEDIFKQMIEDTTSGSVPLITDAIQHAQQQFNHVFGL